MNQQGLLIAIEGIDGSGKSTLAQQLHHHLQTAGYRSILTREPGGTALGQHMRMLVQKKPVAICPKAEYLLFATDRAQHAHEVIIPSLQSGHIVISDRMGDSSIVYQGYARGLDIDTIRMINRWALDNHVPHVTIFVEIDPAIARQRYVDRGQELSSFEKEKESFMRTLHEGFCDLYKNRKDVILIQGNQEKDHILRQALQALIPWFNKHEIRPYTAGSTLAGNC